MTLYSHTAPETCGARKYDPIRDENAATSLSPVVMTPSDAIREPDQPSSFEEALREVIVSCYANGEPVEGEWEITTPVADAPNWIVDVQKVYSDAESEYDPELID